MRCRRGCGTSWPPAGRSFATLQERASTNYLADDLIASAVERQLMIVGEAVTNIARVDRATAAAVGDFPRIIAFRNQLAHNYPAIDHHAVWLIVQREVPVLLERVSALLPPP